MNDWLFRVVALTLLAALGGCSAFERGSESEQASQDEVVGTEAEAAAESEAEPVAETGKPPAEARASARQDPPRATSPAETTTPAPSPEAPAPARAESSDAPSKKREIVTVEVPSGTVLELELLTALDSSVSRVGDEIQARTLSPVYVKGNLVLGEGAYVEGRVTEVEASGRVKGRAKLGFTFDRLKTGTGIEKIRTSFVAEEAESGKKKDATLIGGATGVGAVVGGIIGGKKGAAIGAAIGGAGGTGVVLTTKGEEIRLPAGTTVNVRLEDPVSVTVS